MEKNTRGSIRLTPAQLSAFEIYISDIAVTDADSADSDGEATSEDYRKITECRQGKSLSVPKTLSETAWRVFIDAANSADAERTPEGNRASRSISAMFSNLRNGWKKED